MSGSKEASGQTASDSVYDFLYHDARRVGSFLAQLNPSGHLQGLKRSGRHDKGSGKTDTISPQLGLKSLLGVSGTMGNAVSDLHSQGSEETYDPLWSNARALLDYLYHRKLLVKNIHEAGIGQFVQISGMMKVLNLKLAQVLWDIPEIQQSIALAAKESGNNEQIIGLEVGKSLPHLIQSHFYGRDDTDEKFNSLSWMELEEQNLVISPANLLMKYGLWVSGQWTLIGIKDAGCDAGPVIDTELQQMMGEDWQAAAEARSSTPLALFAEILGPVARQMMGRHGNHYGVTPLMIFREVAAA